MHAALAVRLGLACVVVACLLALAPSAQTAVPDTRPGGRVLDRPSRARLGSDARLRLEQSLVGWRQHARPPPQQRSIPKRIFITVASKAQLSRLAKVGL